MQKMVAPTKQFSLSQLAEKLNLEFKGDGELLVSGLASLSEAKEGQASFCNGPRFIDALKTTKASVVIVHADMQQDCPKASLISDRPELSFAALTKVFSTYPIANAGVDASAVISEHVHLGENVSIGPNCVIEQGVSLGDNCVIGAGSVIGEYSSIGQNTRLMANVTVYHGVNIGQDCIIHSACALGLDGFGFTPGPGGLEKLYQIGGLVIGDRVEMGGGCTIDRGALSDTRIANGVKLDNQVHIAHNVEIGENSALAGCVGVAGSTKIGKNCQFGGMVGINGHIEIGDNVIITGMSLVANSITEPGVYSGGLPAVENRLWLKNVTRFKQLSDMFKTLRKLAKASN